MTTIYRPTQNRSEEQPKEIYTYTVVVQSLAVDYDNVPEDTETVTVSSSAPLFDFEFEQQEAVKLWLRCGYRVVDKWNISHKRFDENKQVFVEQREMAFEM